MLISGKMVDRLKLTKEPVCACNRGKLEGFERRKRKSTCDGGKGWDVPDLAITMVDEE